MAHYQVIIAYDGTCFCGFQRQGSERTVQGELEKALQRIGWKGTTLRGAGRTDSGVHASGQVISFDLEWAHSLEALGRALNANLPSDIAARSVSLAADDFHPRYSARERTYRYKIYCQPERDPLRERYGWHLHQPVDLDLLRKASVLLVGTHDFRAFGTPPNHGDRTVRVVYHAGWDEIPQEVDSFFFFVTANAFLYHMVRRMVFLQVLVGQRYIKIDDFASAILEGKQLKPGLAPPQGLVLSKVRYNEPVM